MNTSHTICILAAHGSSHPGAHAALQAFAERVRRELPERKVFLTYTASRHRGNHTPLETPGVEPLDHLLPLLRTLADAGPIDVAVQSLHVIAGEEYDRLCDRMEGLASMCGIHVAIGGPLLGSALDAPDMALALRQCLLDKMNQRDEAVVLMGHGTTHSAQDLYRHLSLALRLALPRARLGVLEAADPSDPMNIRAIARDLAGSGVRSARLVPLLAVAGRHAFSDLAGDRPGSWKNVLEENGVACTLDMSGLVEREPVAARIVSRLRALTGDGWGAHTSARI